MARKRSLAAIAAADDGDSDPGTAPGPAKRTLSQHKQQEDNSTPVTIVNPAQAATKTKATPRTRLKKATRSDASDPDAINSQSAQNTVLDPAAKTRPEQQADDKQTNSDKVVAAPPAASVKTTTDHTAPVIEDEKLKAAATSTSQFAKAKNLMVPVDEHCSLAGYHVYVDNDDGLIYDALLNQTASGTNANKFYRVQLLQGPAGSFKTWTRWGRVGVVGQHALLGDGTFTSAMREFTKKFKDKSGLLWTDRLDPAVPKNYVFIERSYEAESEPDESQDLDKHDSKSSSRRTSLQCTLSPAVRSLIELIFNQEYIERTMAEMHYDAEKQPLGKLSKTTISRGYQALKNLSVIMGDADRVASASEQITELSNLFYSYIPHNFGFKKPPVLSTLDAVKQEVDLLNFLTDLKETDAMLKTQEKSNGPVHELDALYQGLGLREMMPLDADLDEYKLISEYLIETSSSMHYVHYKIKDIFPINRTNEDDRFIKQPSTNSDRRLLWHGSRTTNFGGILSQGLRIAPPEAPVNGYMFDKGIYLADMSSKSANYCHASSSNGEGLLLLCEAELGKPMQTLTNANYSAAEDAKNKNMLATWGQGQTGPAGWKDANCVHADLQGVMMPDTTQAPRPTGVPGAYLQFNEYIVYDVSQVKLRYLIRTKM